MTFTPQARAVGRAGLLGLLLGVVILGVGGRILMRIIALAAFGAGGFSVGGTIEVVLAGGLFGALAGLAFPLLPRRLGRWRPMGHAGTVFLVIALCSGAARSAAGSIAMPGRMLALLPFAGLILLHSHLLARFDRQDSVNSPSTV